MEVSVVWIALAAFLGGIMSATFGWLDSHEPFSAKKFGRSVGAALIAAVVFAVGYNLVGSIGARDLFIALLGGAGVDVLSNRVLGTLK